MKSRLTFLTMILAVLSVTNLFAGSMPDGWNTKEKNVGTYEIGIDKDVFFSKPHSYFVKSLKNGLTNNDYGILSQAISSEKYKGKRIKFTASIKANIQGSAYFFADLLGLIGNFEPIINKKDWNKISLIIYVPQESKIINFGISLYGSGQVWVDDINIETIAVAKTESIQKSERHAPINLP